MNIMKSLFIGFCTHGLFTCCKSCWILDDWSGGSCVAGFDRSFASVSFWTFSFLSAELGFVSRSFSCVIRVLFLVKFMNVGQELILSSSMALTKN
jgi:hypothetical protein